MALFARISVVRDVRRMGVVPRLDPRRARYGIDNAGVGTPFAAYPLGHAIFGAPIGFPASPFPSPRAATRIAATPRRHAR